MLTPKDVLDAYGKPFARQYSIDATLQRLVPDNPYRTLLGFLPLANSYEVYPELDDGTTSGYIVINAGFHEIFTFETHNVFPTMAFWVGSVGGGNFCTIIQGFAKETTLIRKAFTNGTQRTKSDLARIDCIRSIKREARIKPAKEKDNHIRTRRR